jgi:excisionase family DNA binding protein
MSQKTEQTTVEPLLLTSRQAARILSLSERTLFSLVKSGRIPVVQIGERGIRYDPCDLRRWIESAKNIKIAS